jgi:transposase
VIPASVQDRDCAAGLIRRTRRLFPFIAKIFADGGYAGRKLNADLSAQPVSLEIVKRTDKDAGFKVVRRRWVVERTFSWLRRNRRLMAHYEANNYNVRALSNILRNYHGLRWKMKWDRGSGGNEFWSPA